MKVYISIQDKPTQMLTTFNKFKAYGYLKLDDWDTDKADGDNYVKNQTIYFLNGIILLISRTFKP